MGAGPAGPEVDCRLPRAAGHQYPPGAQARKVLGEVGSVSSEKWVEARWTGVETCAWMGSPWSSLERQAEGQLPLSTPAPSDPLQVAGRAETA